MQTRPSREGGAGRRQDTSSRARWTRTCWCARCSIRSSASATGAVEHRPIRRADGCRPPCCTTAAPAVSRSARRRDRVVSIDTGPTSLRTTKPGEHSEGDGAAKARVGAARPRSWRRRHVARVGRRRVGDPETDQKTRKSCPRMPGIVAAGQQPMLIEGRRSTHLQRGHQLCTRRTVRTSGHAAEERRRREYRSPRRPAPQTTPVLPVERTRS